MSWVGGAKLAGLSTDRSWLAPGPVRGIDFALSGRVVDPRRHRLHVESGELTFGKSRFELDVDVQQSRDYQRIHLEGGAPLASCQALFDSAPEGLSPLLAGRA